MANGRGNDIALLKLSRSARLSHTVGLACLPNGNLMDRVTPGAKCFLTGKKSWSISLIIYISSIIVVTMINYSHMRNKVSCHSPFNPNVFCLE